MTECEYIFRCESCGRPIYAGDKYQPGGDCNLCPEHAATWKDILDFWEDDIAGDREFPHWPSEFDRIEEAREFVESLRKSVERDGPDFKPLREAEA